MKKTIVILMFLIILSGCATKNKTVSNKLKKCNVDIVEGISMKIKEGTLTDGSATVLITDLSGNQNIYGEAFSICKKIDNEWFYLNSKVNNRAWTTKDYSVNEHHFLEMNQSWNEYWGKLKPGEYRLVKTVLSTNEEKVYNFSVDFIIT